MMLRRYSTGCNRTPFRKTWDRWAFTLIELLVVLAIFGFLAAVSLPYVRDIGKGSAIRSAMHQLSQDLAYARQRAISDRAEVYVVFLPNVSRWKGFVWDPPALPPKQMEIATNLLNLQYRGYAIVALRRAGDQPGRGRFRYITEWKALPEGVFIPPSKFDERFLMPFKLNDETVELKPFSWIPGKIRFPTAEGIHVPLPAVGFDPEGRLILPGRNGEDELIPLCTGSVWPRRKGDEVGSLLPLDPDVIENPPGNWTNTYTIIRIDYLTGRARVERPKIKG